MGYLYSREGKLFLRRLTFHNEAEGLALSRIFDDAPEGRGVAVRRYLSLMRAAFERL